MDRAAGVTTRNLEETLGNFVGLHVPQLVTCRHFEGKVTCRIRRGKQRSLEVFLAFYCTLCRFFLCRRLIAVGLYSVICYYEDFRLHVRRRARHHRFTEV